MARGWRRSSCGRKKRGDIDEVVFGCQLLRRLRGGPTALPRPDSRTTRHSAGSGCTVAIYRVDVRAAFEDQFNHFFVSGEGRVVNRRGAHFAVKIRIRAVLQKEPGGCGIAMQAGKLKSAIPLRSDCVHIGSHANEHGHKVRLTVLPPRPDNCDEVYRRSFLVVSRLPVPTMVYQDFCGRELTVGRCFMQSRAIMRSAEHRPWSCRGNARHTTPSSWGRYTRLRKRTRLKPRVPVSA
jgi:hypothetical protein